MTYEAATNMATLSTKQSAASIVRAHNVGYPGTDASSLDRYASRDVDFDEGALLLEQSQPAEKFYVLTSGWAVQYELLADGRRQVLNVALPGSIVGLELEDRAHSYSVEATTPLSAREFDRQSIDDAALSDPQVGMALARATMREQAHAFRWLTVIGRRTAFERVAYLLVDLYCRIRLASPAKRCAHVHIPLTQEDMGDAIGLTNVHVNRMLRELRQQGLITLRHGVLRILNPDALAEIAGYELEVDTSAVGGHVHH